MKRLIIGMLLLIMTAVHQHALAVTYNGNMIQNVNKYVFSDSRVHYYIDWIFVIKDGGFQVHLSQELKNPNDIVTKGMVYGDITFVYGFYQTNEWTYAAGTASGTGISRGKLNQSSIAKSVFNIAYPYAEKIMSEMRADSAKIAKRNAEAEKKRLEEEKVAQIKRNEKSKQEKLEKERRWAETQGDIKKADEAYYNKQYALAYTLYKPIIQKIDFNSELYYKIAVSLFKLRPKELDKLSVRYDKDEVSKRGRREGALEYLNKAIKLNPNYAKYYKARAEVHDAFFWVASNVHQQNRYKSLVQEDLNRAKTASDQSKGELEYRK